MGFTDPTPPFVIGGKAEDSGCFTPDGDSLDKTMRTGSCDRKYSHGIVPAVREI